MRIILIVLGAAGAVAAVVLAGGCGGAEEGAGAADGEGRVEVVAGFYPLAYAAAEVGGERVAVTNLTPPGAEPHDLELSPRDVERVRSADLVLYLGRGFQPALEDALGEAEGEAIDLLAGIGREGDADPHVWLDPLRFAKLTTRIGEALGAEAAAERLVDDLTALHEELERGLADCDRRELVTSHAAFGYLAERYGLDQIAITGLTPEAEPAPRDLERVAELARERGATTIFFETLVSPDVAETVAREIGAQTAVLNPLEGLTEDEIAAGEDYFTIMRANLEALREGLGCR